MGGVTIKSSVYIKRKSSKNKQRNRLDRREDSNQVRVKKIKKIKRTKQSKATTSANSLSALQTSEFPRLNGDHCTHRGAEEALNIYSSGVTPLFLERGKKELVVWRRSACTEITQANQKQKTILYSVIW